MSRWRSRPLVLATALLALVAVLGGLQYRWLTEVSAAERERVRAHLQQSATDLQHEFNREITRAFVVFQIGAPQPGDDRAAALAAAYDRWQATASRPGIVLEVYLATIASGEFGPLQRFDPGSRALQAAEWPSSLSSWRDRARRAATLLPGGAAVLAADPIVPEIPALAVPVRPVKIVGDGRHNAIFSELGGPAAVVIVVFDRARMRDELVAPLVTRSFGPRASEAYLLSIGPRDGQPVFTSASDGQAVALDRSDAVVPLFNVQPDEFDRLDPAGGAGHKVSITIVRRTDGPAPIVAGLPGAGAWELRARHREGSLEELVARSRRRNLAIAGAILLVLAAGIVMIVAYADKRQRLAQQQIEFVAAVSHELRTPLAVICSAADNLADGVVSSASQVQRYGALVGTEGRRLSDMVERVLAYAGIASHRRPPLARTTCEVGSIAREAVESPRRDGEARGVTVRVTAAEPAAVSADASALRSAIQNVVANAVKYSREGGEVDVTVARDNDRVRVTVIDRGLGIDAADVPYVWRPFYRGRRALDAQTRGTGIGLSIVRHVVEAHGGRASIASEPDAGTTVTIELPAADAARAPAARAAVSA